MSKKYPNVTVQLIGRDGNAFAIMGVVTAALRAARVSPEEITAFMNECLSGDYNHLLSTCMEWVVVT